ncbi:MAG: hypothetical protein EOM05_11215 [Clostridia bacterium]|nr:hypothetical protein [Clostridia bacterium]
MKNLALFAVLIRLTIIGIFFVSFMQLNAQQWTAFSAMDATEPVCTVNTSANDLPLRKGMYLLKATLNKQKQVLKIIHQ